MGGFEKNFLKIINFFSSKQKNIFLITFVKKTIKKKLNNIKKF